MKKTIITILVICLLLPVLNVLNATIDPFDMYLNEGELDQYDTDVKKINEYYEKIYFYGEDIYFRDTLKIVENISEITKDKLVSNGGKSWIVINDIAGTVKLEEKHFKIIKNAMDKEKISFVYIGQQYISQINEYIAEGDDRYVYSEDAYSVLLQVTERGMIGEDGTIDDVAWHKFLNGEDKEIISFYVISSIVHAIGDY